MRYIKSLKSIVVFYFLFILLVSFGCILQPSTAHADTGLVAEWTMDDGSGNIASDSSGNGNDLDINGSATWVAGKILGALSFDGSSNYAHDDSTFNTTPSSTMSLCGWIKTSSPTAQTILSFGRNPGNFTNEGIFSVLASGSIQFWDYSNGGGGLGFSSSASGSTGIVDDGNWHSVCFVKNNTAGTYYIDGVESGITTAATNVAYDNTDWTLGKDYRDNDNYFDGLMDDMRVYDIALSSSQVYLLYGIEGYWKFDEGSGTVANDSSGNNNTGTIVGDPTWTTGKVGYALNFGNNQYVSIAGTPISTAIASSSQMTATAWVYANSATPWGTIIKDWPDYSGNDQFHLGFEGTTTKISAYIEQSNGTIIGPVESTSTLPLNSWHLVAMTANGSSTLLYIDGTVVASSTYDGTLHQGGNYIGIGAKLDDTGLPNADNPGYFDGKIDDVHLYDKGLLPDDILTLMEAPPAQVSNLQATGTYAGGFSLTWDPNPVGDNVTNYVIQYSTDGGNSWTPVDTNSNSTSYELSGIGPGDYLFQVKAVNTVGQGLPSTQVEINSPAITYTLGNDCLALEHITTNPGDAYGHYIMSSNIDCSVVPNFSPINFSVSGFGGTFDGAGHTITNLTISTSTIQNVGLFSQIQNSGTVENLTLTNTNVTSGEAYSGILAGYNNGTLQNISVSGTSTGVYAVGGLVGQNDALGVISTSSADVYVIADNNSGNGNVEEVGGFAGESEGSINGSHSLGTVTNATGSEDFYYVGGFAGFQGGDFTDDYATGPIIVNADSSGESDYIGGFVGYAGSAGSIDHSYATGNITDPDDYVYEIGGFVGESRAPLSDDYATGNIYDDNDSNVGDSFYLGGFAGGSDAGAISNCYETGSITIAFPQDFYYVGGFAGYTENDEISQSYSTGNAEGNEAVAGFSGYNEALLSQVYSSGNVVMFGSGPTYAGGLVADNEGDINDAFSTGNISLDSGVTGSPTAIGGLIGNNSDANINRAYASGDISAGTNSSYVGGLVGADYQNGNGITNSYSVGTVSGGTDVGGLIGFESIQSAGNPSYTDLAWYTGSASDVVGDFLSNNGSTDNGPILNLTTGGYGTDENIISNFYDTTEPVYAQGQMGAWDFSSIWESHKNTFPTFQWFSAATYTITASAGTGGVISNEGSLSVLDGSNQSYNITTDNGYTIADVLVDGLSVGAVSSYTFSNISASHTISVTFSAILSPNVSRSGGSVQSQVNNLNSFGDIAAAQVLINQYPYLFKDSTASSGTVSSIQAQIAQLQQELVSFGDSTTTTATTTELLSNGPDLYFGLSNHKVNLLQQFLVLEDKGQEANALEKNGLTNYFGKLTRAALAEFQKSVSIKPAAGYFGLKTKAYLKLLGY